MHPTPWRMRRFTMWCATALLIGMAVQPAYSATEGLFWVRQLGTAGADEMDGVACDPEDNVYTAGRFSGTVDFDPEAGVANLTATGTNDAYVTRYDRDGRLVWARRIGGTGSTGVALTGSIASDGGNAIYVTGNFSGTADFDPGPGVFEMTAVGTSDLYVVKLTTAGDLVWARQISCASGSGAGPLAIAANATSVAFAGTIIGTCDFDPGPGVADVTSTAGMEDIFVAALGASGVFAWAAPFASPGSDIPNGIAVDAAGFVYTVGRARGAIDYDPGPGTDIQTGDSFVIKQSPAGAEQWARALPTGTGSRAFGVAADASGGVYIAGQYAGTTDFDPGPGTANRTATGTDGFLLKLDALGNYAWVAAFGGPGTDIARKVVVGSDSRVHVVGQFSASVDFDPGASIFNLTSAGSSDGFALTLDGAGQFVRVLQVGGAMADPFNDIALDRGGHLVAIGNFAGTADFDPGPGTTSLISAGGSDAFVWKYGWSELRLSGAGATSIAFSPGSPMLFDVVRGQLSDLLGQKSYAQAACFGGLLGAPAIDAESPAPGDGFYYVARGRNCCGEEGYGQSTLVPDPRDALNFGSPCP